MMTLNQTGNELNFKTDKSKKKKKKGEDEEAVLVNEELNEGDPEKGDVPQIGIDNVAYEELEQVDIHHGNQFKGI